MPSILRLIEPLIRRGFARFKSRGNRTAPMQDPAVLFSTPVAAIRDTLATDGLGQAARHG
jgi:hypothetical protein